MRPEEGREGGGGGLKVLREWKASNEGRGGEAPEGGFREDAKGLRIERGSNQAERPFLYWSW
jgi:hypothetical protein